MKIHWLCGNVPQSFESENLSRVLMVWDAAARRKGNTMLSLRPDDSTTSVKLVAPAKADKGNACRRVKRLGYPFGISRN